MAAPKIASFVNCFVRIGPNKIGFVNALTVTENITYGEVRQMGDLEISEFDPVSFMGTWTMDRYTPIDVYRNPETLAFINRISSQYQQIEDTIVYDLNYFDMTIFHGLASVIGQSGNPALPLVTSVDEIEFSTLRDCVTESQSTNFAEASMARTNISGKFRKIISFPTP